jgi:hypothetical protein
MKLRKRLTASEQESEISKTVEEGTQQRWGNRISIQHTLYTPGDLKTLYLSNKEWINSKV